MATIQELTNNLQWCHVSPNENPRDLISRGLDPNKLIQNEKWWEGSLLLRNNMYLDKKIPFEVIVNDFPDEHKTCSD